MKRKNLFLAALVMSSFSQHACANPIHDAAVNGDLAQVQRLIEQDGVDVNKRCEDDESYEGYTPLHLAVIYGHAHIVAYLLAHSKTDVYKDSHDGWTSFMFAAVNNQGDCLRLLCEHAFNLDVNARLLDEDYENFTILRLAAFHLIAPEAFALLLIPSLLKKYDQIVLNEALADLDGWRIDQSFPVNARAQYNVLYEILEEAIEKKRSF